MCKITWSHAQFVGGNLEDVLTFTLQLFLVNNADLIRFRRKDSLKGAPFLKLWLQMGRGGIWREDFHPDCCLKIQYWESGGNVKSEISRGPGV